MSASHGNFWLILFGLAVSIPFIVLSSNLLSRLMDKWPAMVYIGAGILGKVGGEMILTDPLVVRLWHPSELLRYSVEAVLVVARTAPADGPSQLALFIVEWVEVGLFCCAVAALNALR
jgi:predicted tellurium resistance membrane protein TerC